MSAIYGNTSVPGATVTWSGTSSGATVADGGGNYSIPGLANGTYEITPSQSGFFFFPNALTRVVSGVDVSNASFGSTVSANTYAQLAYDNFNRANENPLNPTNWTTATGFGALEVTSNLCVASSISEDCAALYTNASYPTTGQYVQFQLAEFLAGAGNVFMLLFSSLDETTGYYVAFSILSNVIQFVAYVNDGNTVTSGVAPVAFTPGDIFRVEKLGSSLAFFYNNTSIANVSDANASSGFPGIDIDASAFGQFAVTDFVAGSITAASAPPPPAQPYSSSVPSAASQFPVITYLRLDSSYDPIFTTNAELANFQAVEQAIKTRLLLFQGEWWENLNEGTPYFQEIIDYRATPNGQQIMALALAARINGTPYVSAVRNIAYAFDPKKRLLSFSATVQTAFGTVQVSNTPGAAAGVNG